MKEKNFTTWQLYKASGVPKSTLFALMKPSSKVLPKIDTLLHICEGLGISIREFFNDAIFDEAEQD